MKVVLSVIGKFHSFDLARELHRQGALLAIFSGYPRFKLQSENLPASMVHTYPYLQAPYMATPGKHRLGSAIVRTWERMALVTFDRHVAAHIPDCDLFVGLSGSALRTGHVVKSRGARYLCDRGSTHIRTQDRLLREEHDRWGVAFEGIDPRSIEQDEAEYSQADCITVPSSFTMQSFVDQRVPRQKIRRLPYGVDLSRFKPTATAPEGSFDVLFAGGMSLRKGIPYLLQAYARLQHPRKTLTFAGAVSPNLIALMKARGLWPADARTLGHVAQPALADLMSRSHVLVLPSIEDGFGLVMAQAMACGCVVIASRHTGAEDLYTDGEEGYIVPVRDVDVLTDRLQRLADDPALRLAMRERALSRVAGAGGWREYGDHAHAIYQELLR